MKKLLLSTAILCFYLSISAQNNPPTLKARSAVALYGQEVCIDIETEDLDGDSVFIGSNAQVLQAVFTNTNSSRKQATGQFCVTPTRGIHSHTIPYTMVFYATDKKDTVYRSFNLTVRNYPYKVRPVIKWQTNTTFEVDMMGDETEPWSSYGNLEFFAKVYDLNGKLVFEDTNRVFAFTAPNYEKYILISTYKVWNFAAYSTRDTLYPNLNVSTSTPQKNTFTLYPNPTTNKVLIKNLPKDVKSITLFNTLGKEVNVTVNQSSISLNNLPNGIYWVEVETSQGTLERQKIIKTQ